MTTNVAGAAPARAERFRPWRYHAGIAYQDALLLEDRDGADEIMRRFPERVSKFLYKQAAREARRRAKAKAEGAPA